jgi:hypothetical protein
MTDRPITRIVTAEQALGIRRAPIVGPDQRTLLDAPAPAPIAPPSATTLAPNQPTLVTVHSALGYPPRDARILAPNQTTMVNGVPAPVHDEPPTQRLSARPSAPAAAPHPSAPPTMPRARAILFVALACVGSALVAGGLVHALHDRQHRAATAPTAQPPPEPARGAVLRSRR